VSNEYADPKCSRCRGRGFIYGESMLDGGHSCECTFEGMRLENMGRIWRALPIAKDIPGLRENAPLRQLVSREIWITAKIPVFQAHLKAVAFNQPIMWDCRVFSDKDLLTAWLNTARAQGHEIYDAEVRAARIGAMDIDELVESPGLVILVLGIKQAPNKETPNVLLEAIQVRRHLGKPTWVVDQPDQPVDQMHHLCYSETLEMWLSHWPHLELYGPNVKLVGGATGPRSTASETDPEEIVQATDQATDQATEQIDGALDDLGNDDEDSATTDFMDEILRNEEAQERRAQKKAFSRKKGARS
jgi:hypothetical protein